MVAFARGLNTSNNNMSIMEEGDMGRFPACDEGGGEEFNLIKHTSVTVMNHRQTWSLLQSSTHH